MAELLLVLRVRRSTDPLVERTYGLPLSRLLRHVEAERSRHVDCDAASLDLVSPSLELVAPSGD